MQQLRTSSGPSDDRHKARSMPVRLNGQAVVEIQVVRERKNSFYLSETAPARISHEIRRKSPSLSVDSGHNFGVRAEPSTPCLTLKIKSEGKDSFSMGSFMPGMPKRKGFGGQKRFT